MAAAVPISFEFFPPNTPVGDEKLKTVVQELGALKPEFFSVTYGAGGSTRDKTLATVVSIADAGHEAAPHLSCVGSTREQLQEILATYRADARMNGALTFGMNAVIVEGIERVLRTGVAGSASYAFD